MYTGPYYGGGGGAIAADFTGPSPVSGSVGLGGGGLSCKCYYGGGRGATPTACGTSGVSHTGGGGGGHGGSGGSGVAVIFYGGGKQLGCGGTVTQQTTLPAVPICSAKATFGCPPYFVHTFNCSGTFTFHT
jgi:hypothetical protein